MRTSGRLAGAALAALGWAAPLVAAPMKEREPPLDVPPVIIEGRRYEALAWGKSRGLGQNGGYVAAFDQATGREMWVARVYRVAYPTGRENDKADVFIRRLEPADGGASLLVETERGARYRLDLRSRRVRRE